MPSILLTASSVFFDKKGQQDLVSPGFALSYHGPTLHHKFIKFVNMFQNILSPLPDDREVSGAHFEMCVKWLTSAYDYHSRTYLGHHSESIAEHLISMEVASALQLIIPPHYADTTRVMHQRGYEVVGSDDKLVRTDPDVVLETRPMIMTTNNQVQHQPSRVYWVCEVKKKLSKDGSATKTRAQAHAQLKQACTFALQDSAAIGHDACIGRIMLGMLISDQGIEVIGVCDGAPENQSNDELHCTTWWCPLVSLKWNEQNNIVKLLKCMTRFMDDMHNTAYLVSSPFHPVPFPNMNNMDLDHAVELGQPELYHDKYNNVNKFIMQIPAVSPVTVPLPLTARQQQDMFSMVRRCSHKYTPPDEHHESTVILSEGGTYNYVCKLYDYHCAYCSVNGHDAASCTRRSLLGPQLCCSTMYRRQPNDQLLRRCAVQCTGQGSQAHQFAAGIVVHNNLTKDINLMTYPLLGVSAHGCNLSNSDLVIKRLQKIRSDLDYLHREQYVHGDVRAANIIFATNDDPDDAWLIDFDLAAPTLSRYPECYAHADIQCRHPDAVAGHVMKPEHDIHAIDYFIADIQNLNRGETKLTGTPVKNVCKLSY